MSEWKIEHKVIGNSACVGIIVYKGMYYYTDGWLHGITSNKGKATQVTEERYKGLVDRWLVPEDAKWTIQ